MLALGWSYKEIERELGCGDKTITKVLRKIPRAATASVVFLPTIFPTRLWLLPVVTSD